MALIASAVFPYITCLQFPAADAKGMCTLSWQKRLGQAGAFIMYLSALLGVVSLYWREKVVKNREIAEREIEHISRLLTRLHRVNERSGTQLDNIASVQRELQLARRELAIASSFPRLLKITSWIAVLLVGLGTILQVVETGS